MKFLSLFGAVALSISTASGTIVTVNSKPCGQGGKIATFKSCGVTGLRNYNVASANVNFEKATITFYKVYDKGKCAGAKISVASDKCVTFPFRPMCAYMHGGTC